MTSIKKLTLPRPVYIEDTTDFTVFGDTLRTLCEKCLYPKWDWSFQVGGQVHTEIQRKNPEEPCLKIIHETVKLHVKGSEGGGDGEVKVVTNQLMEVLGK